MRPLGLLMAVLVLAGCDRMQAPQAPSPQPAPPPPAASGYLTGRVVATVTGEPLGGITVGLGSQHVETPASGSFVFDLSAAGASSRLSLSAPGIIPRSVPVALGVPTQLTVDAIVDGNGFNLDYYRRLVRGTLDRPALPLRRWTRAPRIYLRTIDEQGLPVDEAHLRQVEAALLDDPAAWTGGRFGIAEMVRGTASRIGDPEWITVRWANPSVDSICGSAQVGYPGGWIELHHLNPRCHCDGGLVSQGTVRHEFGHAMGFFHTDEPGDVLSTKRSGAEWCYGRPSALERFHAAIAYSRPVGNVDPDWDPGSAVQTFEPRPIVVVD